MELASATGKVRRREDLKMRKNPSLPFKHGFSPILVGFSSVMSVVHTVCISN